MADYDDSGNELEFLRKNTSKPPFDIGSLDFPPAADLSNIDLNLLDVNSPVGSGLFDAAGNINLENIGVLTTDPELFAAFAKANPEDAAILRDLMGGDYGFAPVGGGSSADAASGVYDPNDQSAAETARLQRQAGNEGSGELKATGVPVGDPNDPTGTKKLADISGNKTSLPDKLKKLIADATGLGEDTIGELGKYGLLAGIAKLAYDDAEKARKAKLGYIAPGGSAKRAVISPGGSVSYTKAASGGIMSLAGGGSVEQERTAQQKQLDNLYRQLEAMDAWNTTQASNAGRELSPQERMMAVGVRDDLTGAGPGVILSDPSKGRSQIVSSGSLGSMFEQGDPTAAYAQAKNALPYFQTAASLGISGPTTQAQERQIVDALKKQKAPALSFMEYGKGTFAPPDYGVDPNVARRREEDARRGINVNPFEFFKDYLNLSPYQGGLPTIYSFAEGGSVNERPVFIDAGVMSLDRGGTVGYTPEGNVDPYASFRRSGGISYKEPSGVNTSFAPFIFGSSDPISQTGRFDEEADFREPSAKSLIQAKYNDEYAPEGIIANEVMQRAIEDYPFEFNPNIIPLSKDDALLSSIIDRSNMLEEAKNNVLNQVVSIDQITGDIDPVQTIRNVLELEPKIVNALPEIQNLQTNVSNLESQPFGDIYLNQGFKSPYLDEGVSPDDLNAIKYGGENVQNTTKAIGSLLNERFINPDLYKVSYPFIIDESGVPLRDSFGNFITPESNSEKGGGEGGIGGGYGGAAGGIASLQPKRKQPFYLGGPTDGMADQIPAHIDNQRPAALSDGEFVIPADVVSHLGNGNSNAGAKRLYEMMDSIREARTGNSKQGKQINPNKFLPR